MFDKISIDDTYYISKTIREEDIIQFAGITGDFNPLHLDSEYAKKTRFGERIAHGFLTASLISAVIGKTYSGSIYLNQTLKFVKPVRIGDTIRATIKVLRKDEQRKFIELETICSNQNKQNVIEGRALILIGGIVE